MLCRTDRAYHCTGYHACLSRPPPRCHRRLVTPSHPALAAARAFTGLTQAQRPTVPEPGPPHVQSKSAAESGAACGDAQDQHLRHIHQCWRGPPSGGRKTPSHPCRSISPSQFGSSSGPAYQASEPCQASAIADSTTLIAPHARPHRSGVRTTPLSLPRTQLGEGMVGV